MKLTQYILRHILYTGMDTQWLYGKYSLPFENATFEFKATTDTRLVKVLFNTLHIMNIALDSCEIIPYIGRPPMDVLIANTNGGELSKLHSYMRNFPAEQMLYDFVHLDLSDKEVESYNVGDKTYHLSGGKMTTTFGGPFVHTCMTKDDDGRFCASDVFIQNIINDTSPPIIVPSSGKLDDLLYLIAAKYHEVPKHKILGYTFEDMWGTL